MANDENIGASRWAKPQPRTRDPRLHNSYKQRVKSAKQPKNLPSTTYHTPGGAP